MSVVFSDDIPKSSRMREWWYNSLDAAVTLDIHETLAKSNANAQVYAFERALQGPALDMMQRGFLVDEHWRQHYIRELSQRDEQIQEKLNVIAHGVWGRELNPNSPLQLKEFFYDALALPVQYKFEKGERKVSTNRDALEKLEQYYLAIPFITCILLLRDLRKKVSVLRVGVDPDGRLRCTYNVCGTETGRWASSKNVFGRGTNLQNITEELRRMCVADPGYILVYVDGEQAESRAVGFIHFRVFGDSRYLDACEAGDLHTSVSKLVWPDLGWTGNAAADKEIAEQQFYRWFSYRDMAKRGGHGTNYYGTPPTMARHLKVPTGLISNFQASYFGAFPAMRRWHTWVAHQLQTHQSLTTFLGRERTFYGRPDDDATLREAIAYEPQSVVGDIVNEGGHRVWSSVRESQVLAQQHDAYIFQIPEDRLDLIPVIQEKFSVPVTCNGRTLRIPAECKVGWNWARCEMGMSESKRLFRDGNPDGLQKWKGRELRVRSENPLASVLDRKFC